MENKNIFTFTYGNVETNIVKNKVLFFQKCNYEGGVKEYIIYLAKDVCQHLPDEETYNAFCKWMKEE